MGETLRICGSKRGTRRNTEKETRLGFHDRGCDPVRAADGPGGRLGDRRARLGHRLLPVPLVVLPSVRGGHPSSRCRPAVPRITSVHGGRVSHREGRGHEAPLRTAPRSTKTAPLHPASHLSFVPPPFPGRSSPFCEHSPASPPFRPA